MIELARNVAKTPNATNKEFDKNAGINVISLIENQENTPNNAETMSLVLYDCKPKYGTFIFM